MFLYIVPSLSSASADCGTVVSIGGFNVSIKCDLTCPIGDISKGPTSSPTLGGTQVTATPICVPSKGPVNSAYGSFRFPRNGRISGLFPKENIFVLILFDRNYFELEIRWTFLC